MATPRLTLGQFIALAFRRPRRRPRRPVLGLLRRVAPHDPARLRAAHAAGEPARDRAPRRAPRGGGAPGRRARSTGRARTRHDGDHRAGAARRARRPPARDRRDPDVRHGDRHVRPRRAAARRRRSAHRPGGRRAGVGVAAGPTTDGALLVRRLRPSGDGWREERRRSRATATRVRSAGDSDDRSEPPIDPTTHPDLHRAVAPRVPRPRALERPRLLRSRRRPAREASAAAW